VLRTKHPLGSVAARRRQLKLNDPTRRKFWSQAEDSLLGKRPDTEIARKLNRPLSGVKNRRKKLKIPALKTAI
jgi:hypothetical protein